MGQAKFHTVMNELSYLILFFIVTVNSFNFTAIKFCALRVQHFIALKICFFLIVLVCYNGEQIYSQILFFAFL